MQFSEILGLDEIKKKLIHAVKSNHVAHAQLFAGQSGSGALAMALAYATYLNCLNPSESDACGQCSSCQKFRKLIHPDLHFVFPTATNKTIKKRENANSQSFMKAWRQFIEKSPYQNLRAWTMYIEAENKTCLIPVHEGRNMIRMLSLKPYEATYKTLIIWLPEFMNVSAGNALLKILEEPPSKTLFLLVTEARDQILQTILSRTQPVIIRPFTDHEIKENLIHQFKISNERAGEIATLAHGNLSEALRIYQQTQHSQQTDFVEWMRLCFKKDYTEMVYRSNTFQESDKENQKHLLQYGLSMLREAFAYKYGGDQLVRLEGDALGFIQKFSSVVHEKNIELLTRYFTDALVSIERNASPKITFLDLSLKISKIIT